MLLKIPIKKITWIIASSCKKDNEQKYCLYKRCNCIILFLTCLVAVLSYYILYRIIELDHFKLCCTLKAAAIAFTIYAVYELWFGSDYDMKKNKK